MTMIIDGHFHMMAMEDERGCMLSPEARRSLPGWVASLMLGTLDRTVEDLFTPESGAHGSPITSKLLRKRLLAVIDGAKEVDGAVLLALDAIVDADGAEPGSDVVVTNDYVARVIHGYQAAAGKKKLFLGASVHPNRPDALERLEAAKEKGAVLVKWVPSSQEIDTGGLKARTFYRRLADLDLPLLCHAGWEGAIPVRDDKWREFENPIYLRAALDAGVTVIVAHCAAPYKARETNYVPTLARMMREADKHGWRLFTDISALLLGPWRAKAVRGFLFRTDPGRLLYGSDFPIPTQDLSLGFLQHKVALDTYLEGLAAHNPLDKDILFKRAHGMPPSVFHNTAKVLKLC